jgi:RNA polymerase sigma factor (sigma-70 family)
VSLPPTSSPDAASAEQTRWFAQEVHAHDTSLKSYLRGSFPSVRDVEDIVQESYIRIWTYRAAEPVRSVKAFLFKVAQRIALDVLRHERRSPVASVGNLAGLDVLEDKPAVHETLGLHEKVSVLIEAIDALPARCREVVILRKLKFMSQRDVSVRLGISEKGVEIQLARGLHRCREFLRKRDVTEYFRHGS